MSPDLLQACLAIFGVGAMAMAVGPSAIARKWSPVVGLAGQPFWFYFATTHRAWGLLTLSAAFTALYAWGLWIQWRPNPDQARAFEAAELAAALADEASVTDLQMHCPVFSMSGVRWLDTENLEDVATLPFATAAVARATRYLELRGHLQRHPVVNALVRINQ